MTKIREERNMQVQLKEFAFKELDNILNYWIFNTIDNTFGGFVGKIDNNQRIDFTASKGLILNARILWTFSAAYKVLHRSELLAIADRAYTYIVEKFFDIDNDGYYWLLNNSGKPEDTKKQINAQAFVIYGFSEYYSVRQNKDCLSRIKAIFNLIEEKAFDNARNGYYEAFTNDWKEEPADLRLSSKDMNEKKTMNTHLHVLEAYTNFYKNFKDDKTRIKILNLLNIFNEKILNLKDYHFDLFFDENWVRKSDIISFGHDIEGSWLLYEAAEAIGSELYIEKQKQIALSMAGEVSKALNKDGGLEHDKERNGKSDGEFEWWAQAESIVGFINAFQLSGNMQFLEAAEKMKNFIENYFLDKKFGEWYYRIDSNYKPILHYDKVGFWKCPYHNARMCIEVIKRLSI
jgi:mannobiose 2-epimerase